MEKVEPVLCAFKLYALGAFHFTSSTNEEYYFALCFISTQLNVHLNKLRGKNFALLYIKFALHPGEMVVLTRMLLHGRCARPGLK